MTTRCWAAWASHESGSRPSGEPGAVKAEEEPQAGPKMGEGETAARAGDAAPLSPRQAAAILGNGHRDPMTMVTKLLAFEGRTLRRRATGRSAASGQK